MSVRRNLVASALGNGWAALVQIAFVPVYIALLGVEAYGLIGLFAVLVVLLSVLDSGLAPAVSREVTRALAGARGIGEVRTLLRSVEVVFLVAGLVIAALATIAAGWLADHWLRMEVLQAASAASALRILGVQLAFRLFVVLYRSVVAGAQDLVWLSAFTAVFATLRGAGVVPLLWAWPSIEAFFAFQAAATALEAGVLGWKAWGLLHRAHGASFSWPALGEIRRFSAGLTLAATLWLILSQSDRVLLSAILPLAEVGHYALASSVAGTLSLLVAPIATVAYSRLNELAARGDRQALFEAFHDFAQMVAVVVAPAALVLALFAEPILLLWTGQAALSAAAAPLITALAIAGLLNACMALVYALQLVHGRSHALAGLYATLLALFVPSVYIGAPGLGAMAAGCAWIAIATLALALSLPMLRAIMPAAEVGRWLGWDVTLPIAAAGLGVAVLRMTAAGVAGNTVAASILAAYVVSLCAAIAALPRARRWLAQARTRRARQ